MGTDDDAASVGNGSLLIQPAGRKSMMQARPRTDSTQSGGDGSTKHQDFQSKHGDAFENEELNERFNDTLNLESTLNLDLDEGDAAARAEKERRLAAI